MLLHVSFFTLLFLIVYEDFLSSCFCTSVFPLNTFAYKRNRVLKLKFLHTGLVSLMCPYILKNSKNEPRNHDYYNSEVFRDVSKVNVAVNICML